MSEIIDWADLLFTKQEAAAAWVAIFNAVAAAAAGDAGPVALEAALTDGDRLLADAAWELWRAYPTAAPPAGAALVDWWRSAAGPAGRAVLILDSFSVRELRLLLRAAAQRHLQPQSAGIRGANIPTDTAAAAHALGLNQRSQLKGARLPPGFLLSSDDLYSDVTDLDFETLAGQVPPRCDILLWHEWLDRLIHHPSSSQDVVRHLGLTTSTTLSGDGFWRLVDALRRGRQLLITGDHGYALSQRFVELPAPLAATLRAAFGAQRCGERQAAGLTLLGEQPLTLEGDGRSALIGPYKWRVEGGFPRAGHGGVTLAEVCVPFLLFGAT